jgi:uncharacterized metal-binding protein YceD (DUF177 family)
MEKDPEILIDIKSIFESEIGISKTLPIKASTDEIYDIDDIQIVKSITGRVRLTNIGESVLAEFEISIVMKLLCSRCAKEFNSKLKLDFSCNFSDSPIDDDFPIRYDKKIDVLPAVRERVLLSIPMQTLCSKNCKINIK